MTTASDELGRRGEALAAAWLARRGYRILARNCRTRFGEIDLVAREAGELVFVEVKTRRGDAFGAPLEAIDRRKLEHWRKSALAWLAAHGRPEAAFRFDAVGVDLSGPRPAFELARDLAF